MSKWAGRCEGAPGNLPALTSTKETSSGILLTYTTDRCEAGALADLPGGCEGWEADGSPFLYLEEVKGEILEPSAWLYHLLLDTAPGPGGWRTPNVALLKKGRPREAFSMDGIIYLHINENCYCKTFSTVRPPLSCL